MTLRDYLEVAAVAYLIIQGIVILMNLDQLKAEVAQDTTVMDGAARLLGGLATQLAAFKNEPASIQAIADSLVNGRQELAAAIATGTAASGELPAPADPGTGDDSQTAPEGGQDSQTASDQAAE